MTTQQEQYTSPCSRLSTAVKHGIEEKSITENFSYPRICCRKNGYYPLSFQPQTIYYNSNHRYQQRPHFTRSRPSSIRCQQQQHYNSHDRFQYQYPNESIRPLMEIKDDLFSTHFDFGNNENDNNDNEINYHIFKRRNPKQRGQYRNRKAELDWDHAFDLDLINLYATHIDTDHHSLTNAISSSENSFSSI